MPDTLTSYRQRLHTAAGPLRASLEGPVLVWKLWPEPVHRENEDQLSTHSFPRAQLQAEDRETWVQPLRKAGSSSNPFAVGVTVGRTPHNDVVLAHPSVSRFHAYFQLDPRTRTWSLVDAESKNGTFVEDVRLAPSKPVPLGEAVHLAFGDVQATFLMPDALLRLLEEPQAASNR